MAIKKAQPGTRTIKLGGSRRLKLSLTKRLKMFSAVIELAYNKFGYHSMTPAQKEVVQWATEEARRIRVAKKNLNNKNLKAVVIGDEAY